MTEQKAGRAGQIIAACGKSAAYLALFLGSQAALVYGYMIAVAVRLALEGVLDEAAMFDALYEQTLAASTALTLISGLLTLAVVLLFYLIRRKKLGEALWLRKVQTPTLFAGAACAPALYFLVTIVLAMLPEQLMEDYAEASSGLDDASFVAFLAVVVVAPVVEEVIFRGLIMTRLAKVMPGWLAVVISAAIFGICHGDFVWFCYAGLLGVVFGLMDIHANSILPSILGHMAFNCIGQIFTMLNTWFPEGDWEAAAVLTLLALAILLPALDRKAVNAIFRPLPAARPEIAAPIETVVEQANPVGDGFTADSTYSWQDEVFESDPWSE